MLTHAKRVLDGADIAQITKLQLDFSKALGMTSASNTPAEEKQKKPGLSQGLKSNFKSIMSKKRDRVEGGVKFQTKIEEAENEEDES